MTRWPTFAEWQFSKRIMPWTLVHDWSEFQFRLGLFSRDVERLGKTIVEVLQPAFDKLAKAFTDLAKEMGIEG